jgi:hypothetical protein
MFIKYIPDSSLSQQGIHHDKENNVTYDDESNWLHRNDAYQVHNIGGRMRAIADMPTGHEMQTISTILKCIAQGNIIVVPYYIRT